MRQRSQRKCVFLRVLALPEHLLDKVAAAHVVHQVAEFLAAERIIAQVLNDRAAIGVGVGFLDLIVREAGKAVLDQRTDVRRPQQVDDFFVGEDRVGKAASAAEQENEDQRERANTYIFDLRKSARRSIQPVRTYLLRCG